LIKACKAFAPNAPLEWSELTLMAHFPFIKELVEKYILLNKNKDDLRGLVGIKNAASKRRCHRFCSNQQPLGLQMEDKS